MIIAENKVVKMHYSVTDNDNNSIDNSFDGEPLIFIVGTGYLIQGLEDALQGKQAGDTLSVTVEPEKENWDLNFTVFTNEIEGYGSYGYSDFVVNNAKANAKVYMIDTEVETELSYDNFTLANVDASKFINDQRGVGSSWRNGGGPGALPSLKDNVFYVMSDTDGNLYKIKFLALTNADGERGHPEFVYSLLK